MTDMDTGHDLYLVYRLSKMNVARFDSGQANEALERSLVNSLCLAFDLGGEVRALVRLEVSDESDTNFVKWLVHKDTDIIPDPEKRELANIVLLSVILTCTTLFDMEAVSFMRGAGL